MGGFRAIRQLGWASLDPLDQRLPGQIEERRSTDAGVLAAATLACRSCDAPVAPGPTPLLLDDELWCPVCRDSGPVREFISLAAPTRPACVVVRVSLPAHR